MEKLQYLCWGDAADPHAVVKTLLRQGPVGLSAQLDDADARVPVPLPPPADDPTPSALFSIWLDRYDDRGPYEALLDDAYDEVDGYLVTESLYTDYGGNRWGRPRDWPDGERSPGVVMVTLLEKPERMSFEDWIAHWHGVQSPVSERLQPRMRYVRNAVARPVTPGARPYLGIVEEAWPSAEHVTDPMLFYCADGDAEKMQAHLNEMLASVTGFLELDRIRSFTTSEYLVRTPPWARTPAKR
ncbi:MAG TPA: hypothetical protein VIC35_13900 [Acidimicrobiia bacterium]|jgi:hypothetical protein